MKFILLTALLFFRGTILPAQFSKLKGTWITSESEFLFISDTSSEDNNNWLGTMNNEKNLLLFLNEDTLSFQEHYTTSADNYKKMHIVKYDFEFSSLGDSILLMKPVTTPALNFFGGKPSLSFKRKKLLVDTSIHFEKIIFHTTPCFGSCGTYHLQIDNQKKIMLYAERVYKESNSFLLDSTKKGYYKGSLAEEDYNGLISELQTCNLRKLSFDDVECCDGSVITLIIYFNGQRKYLKSMFPPRIASDLINCLYQICSTNVLKKTDKYFMLEQ